MRYEMKPLFEERMRKLMPDSEDFDRFNEIVHTSPRRFIRCNTLKISADALFERLNKKWKVVRPYERYPEIMVVEGKFSNGKNDLFPPAHPEKSEDKINSKNSDRMGVEHKGEGRIKGKDSDDGVDKELSKSASGGNAGGQNGAGVDGEIIDLGPGELGNAIEHLLGYYYVQEISSMLPPIALNPRPGDFVLDLCSSPGSKTTQMAAMMENKGTIIANDIKLDRIKILGSNLERCGVMNAVLTRNDGVGLCSRLAKLGYRFDKILLDAPCSGEGTLRSSPKTFNIWNVKIVKKLSREQKKLFAFAVKCLKEGGEIVYSTCTHSPEENESVVDFALRNFPVEVEKINLPLKCRPGVKEWNGEEFSDNVSDVCRIYPQDNDSEGFFVAKFKLLREVVE